MIFLIVKNPSKFECLLKILVAPEGALIIQHCPAQSLLCCHHVLTKSQMKALFGDTYSSFKNKINAFILLSVRVHSIVDHSVLKIQKVIRSD